MREQSNETCGPGRPREFDKAEALSRIMEVFWEQGYEGTGLTDLLQATGLAKASLYAAFGNKNAMYEQALVHYERLVVDKAVQVLKNEATPAWDRLNNFLSAPIIAMDREGDRRGCFLCNAAADRATRDDDTAAMIRRGYDKLLDGLSVVIRQLDHDRTDQLAPLALATYSGLRIMARAGVETQMLEQSRNACLVALNPERIPQANCA